VRLEPQPGGYTRREGPAGDLMLRRQENALVASPGADAVPAEMDAEGAARWNAWIDGRLATERGEMIAIIEHAMDETGAAFAREIDNLAAENLELKGLLSSALSALDAVRTAVEVQQRERQDEKLERRVRDQTVAERSARVSELQRTNAATAAELSRQQRDRELADRDHRIQLLEVRLEMLLRHLSMTDLGLPKGL